MYSDQNPELEERLKRLRAQQANRDYREMVRDIDVTEVCIVFY